METLTVLLPADRITMGRSIRSRGNDANRRVVLREMVPCEIRSIGLSDVDDTFEYAPRAAAQEVHVVDGLAARKIVTVDGVITPDHLTGAMQADFQKCLPVNLVRDHPRLFANSTAETFNAKLPSEIRTSMFLADDAFEISNEQARDESLRQLARTAESLLFIEGILHTTRQAPVVELAETARLRFADRWRLPFDRLDWEPQFIEDGLWNNRLMEVDATEAIPIATMIETADRAVAAMEESLCSLPSTLATSWRSFDFALEGTLRRHLAAWYPDGGASRVVSSGYFGFPDTSQEADDVLRAGKRLLRTLQDVIRLEDDTTPLIVPAMEWLQQSGEVMQDAFAVDPQGSRIHLEYLIRQGRGLSIWWTGIEQERRMASEFVMNDEDAAALSALM